MAENKNILLSVRVSKETKAKLDQLCDQLEETLGFRTTQAQALEFAIKCGMDRLTGPKETPVAKTDEPGEVKTARTAKRPKSKPAPDPAQIPDETDKYKLALKGRYAQFCVGCILTDENGEWTAVPYEYLYDIYLLWLPKADNKDPNKDSPLNYRQFVEQVLLWPNDNINKTKFEGWTTDENGYDMSSRISGSAPASEKVSIENWAEKHPGALAEFKGFLKEI